MVKALVLVPPDRLSEALKVVEEHFENHAIVSNFSILSDVHKI
jgi:hypothetical protein